ncbi:MAG: Maf family protein [Clostridia bacterium]|nr:Maf family protein [Clostridia bacterium]
MNEIVLASASPRRSELLKQVGMIFRVIPSDMEEYLDEKLLPEELVQNLAFQKASSVAQNVKPDSIVIGADTIVVKDGNVLGKPKNAEDAFDMLRSLQDGWHEVITGVSVVHAPDKKCVKSYEKTYVKMRHVSDDFIRSYIATKEPMDKAGAYGIQGMGALLVEKIDGCYFNVVGLPLVRLAILLEEFDVKIL